MLTMMDIYEFISYLRDIDPRGWAPGKGVSDHVEIDHNNHGNGRRRNRAALGVGRMRRENGSDDEHHGGHPDGTTDQTPLAAPSINANKQEDGSGNNLDGAVDTSCKERRVCAADADRLEDLGSIVSNAVGSGELLPEHDAKGQRESIPVALLQRLLPGDAFGKSHLFLDGSPDLSHFLLHIHAIGRLVADVGQRSKGLFLALLLHQPSRRLLEEDEAAQHEAARHKLEADGDAPLLGALLDVQRHAVVEPVGKGASDDQKLLEQTGDTATDGRRAVLADEDGRDGGHATDAEAGNDTAAVDLANGVARARLDGRANEEDYGEEHEGVASAEAFVEESGRDGAEEAAGREQRHDVGSYMGVFGGREAARVCGQAKV